MLRCVKVEKAYKIKKIKLKRKLDLFLKITLKSKMYYAVNGYNGGKSFSFTFDFDNRC